MIDAQAVVNHLQALSASAPEQAPPQDRLLWLQQALAPLPVQHHRDANGNDWFTLPGKNDRSVVLGSYLELDPSHSLDSRLGLVAGVETLKALAHRTEDQPPCTIKLVVWAERPTSPDAPTSTTRPLPLATLLVDQSIHAYLELHVEPATELQQHGTPLGVVTPSPDALPVVFHPQLMALCDEAIRELTGASATLAAGPAPHATDMARIGVPTAMMVVQSLAGPADAARLHLLEAAEAFGRWSESTMHLVAGDELDLWAREGRVPHS